MNEQNKHAALTIAQQYPPTQYNLLVPMQTVTEIADIQKPVMNSVKISTDLNDGEIYEMEKAKDEWRDSKGYVHKASPAKYALTKKGLTKLMRAAGIKILSSRPVVPSTCQKCAEVNRSIGKPIRCGGCPNKDVKHEVRISVPQLTGENVTIVAHKEIAVEDVTAGMTEKQRAEFMKFRSEMCESKALNRALRTAMQIKSSYLIEEFRKPFVVAYLVPNLDNPTVREEAVKSMFGAANDLYGSRPKTSHTVYVDDDDDGYVQPEPDFEVVPEQPQQEQPPERPAQRPRQQQPAPSNRQQGRNGDSEFCADCGKQVGLDVAEYSRKHFGGVAYCRDCQRNHVINEAIDTKRKISFYYTDFDIAKQRYVTNDGNPYTVSPYTLIWDGDYYYMRGFCDERQEMRNFRLDRIAEQPKILNQIVVMPPEDYTPADYSKHVFRMYDTEEPVKVQLYCHVSVMKYLIDNFGTDFECEPVDADHFKATVSVCTSTTFYCWVFGFNGKIKIAGPQQVTDEYKEMLLSALNRM